MADDSKQSPWSESSMFPWMKSAVDMWLNVAQAVPPNADSTLRAQTAVQNRFTKQMETNLNFIKSFSQMMSQPESLSAAANSITALPEILIKMSKSMYEAFSQIHNQLVEKAGRIGRQTEAYNFDNIDQEVFRALSDVYEKELRQYLKIPPLGLTRFYQERLNELLDKHNLYETTMAEFLSVLYLPIEKSFSVFQERLRLLAEEGKFPKDPRESYAIWIKILEGHYMTLFKSKEYTDALHRTLNRTEDFLMAKDKALRDFLQLLPVATHSDLDDLYKEFHVLKKRVKELEKRLNISPNTLTVVK